MVSNIFIHLQQHHQMLGSPHGPGAAVVNRYHSSQNPNLAGDGSLVGTQSLLIQHPPSTTTGPGLLTRFVSPSAITSAQATSISCCNNSKSLPNIPTAIGKHLSGSKVSFCTEIQNRSYTATLVDLYYIYIDKILYV